MLSISHTLISLPFAVYMDNPILIFLAAFIWHLFADTLLHWNIFPHQFKRYPTLLVAADIIGGLIASWLLVGNQLLTLPVLAAIAGGNAPDVIHGLLDIAYTRPIGRKLTIFKPFFIWHDKIQLETASLSWGLISQVALIAISVSLI